MNKTKSKQLKSICHKLYGEDEGKFHYRKMKKVYSKLSKPARVDVLKQLNINNYE